MNLNKSDLARPKTEERVVANDADYTSSEDDSYEDDSSSDEDEDDDIYPKLMKHIIPPLQERFSKNAVNEALKNMFDGVSGIKSHAGSDQTTNSGSSSAAGSGFSETGRAGGNRKRGMADGSPSRAGGDDEANKDDPNKRQKQQSGALLDSNPSRTYLACPFYKRNPDLYRDKRSCPGPGWPTVSRLKYSFLTPRIITS